MAKVLPHPLHSSIYSLVPLLVIALLVMSLLFMALPVHCELYLP